MLTILSFALTGFALFWFGYYLGNQIGSTRHIREHLREVRDTRGVAEPVPTTQISSAR